MAKASIVKEILVKTANKVGMMAAVADDISNSGVNITALNAFGVDKDAVFRIITSDNSKAIGALKAKNIEVSERDAVLAELENKPGTAADMGRKLKEANIDITYIYGSTCGCGTPSAIIFNCSDNKKAL